MKLTKGLFLLCAGLSLYACSSDDEVTNQLPEGEGIVEVRIVPPTIARAVTGATTDSDSDNKVTLTGTYKVKLEAVSGGKTIELTPSETLQVATFTGVTGPKKVIVTLNDGVADYTNASIDTLNIKSSSHITADKVPAYGETIVFNKQSTTTTTEGKVTTTYGAEVQMAIPVARLEIGTISLSSEATGFSKLQVGGVYLDKLRSKGSKYSNGKFEEQAMASDTTDYQFSDTENQFGNGVKYVLGDVVTNVDLKTENAVLPETGKVYAYNFFGATPAESPSASAVNPQFKIYFSETKLTEESDSAQTLPRYAMITKYKSGDNDIVLENGKIYRITDVELKDANIVGDEENKEVEYNVEVTVTEAVWEIVSTTGVWAGDDTTE